jgi:hypothetical protein
MKSYKELPLDSPICELMNQVALAINTKFPDTVSYMQRSSYDVYDNGKRYMLINCGTYTSKNIKSIYSEKSCLNNVIKQLVLKYDHVYVFITYTEVDLRNFYRVFIWVR